MKELKKFALSCSACVALFFGSVSDETAQIVFALRLADPVSISALFSASLGGGMLASAFAPRILKKMGPRRTVFMALFFQSIFIAVASLINQFFGYLAAAIALGCTGSIFWSAVMVAVPEFARCDSEIDRMNRVIQAVRNLGYVIGPLLGSTFYAATSGPQALLLLAAMVVVAATVNNICARFLNLPIEKNNIKEKENMRVNVDFRGLLCSEGVVRAILPLIVTVIVTSALNVLLLVRIRSDLNFNAQAYGVIVCALSLGLVLAPLTLARLFNRLGDAAGASAAASLIGASICWLANADVIWSIVLSTFVIGSANGVQNTLMANFMMKKIDAGNRVNQIPAYMFIIQVSVLIGFLSAGLMRDVQQTGGYLLIIGIVATIVGFCGFLVNFTREKIHYANES